VSPSPRAETLAASPPMFRSRWLDRLTRVHPSVPAILFIPFIAVMATRGVHRLEWGPALVWIAGGYALWTLTEYWLHRALFHFEPSSGIGQRLHWMMHGVHHDHPNDPLRLVMPPSVSVPMAALFYLLFHSTVGPERTPALAAGFATGYLAYDMLHYAVHHAPPKTRLFRFLRSLHLRHHFEDDHAGYGVSAPYWDHVFGTAFRGRRADD